MIKATLVERYIKSENRVKRSKVEEIVHEVRYFSSMEKFNEWYDTFKAELWEDDKTKVDLTEGIYVRTEEVKLDNVEKPAKIRQYATFRNGVSMRYAS